MPHKVSLSRLKLTDFRNYAGLSLSLDGRHVVLTGQNDRASPLYAGAAVRDPPVSD